MARRTRQRHDRLFRLVFSNPKEAAAFLRARLQTRVAPEQVVGALRGRLLQLAMMHAFEQAPAAGPQLLLQAFLQRIVNSGGRIEREYGLGLMRTDLLIVWPAAARPPGRQRKMVIECKLLHGGMERTIRDGAAQTRAYLDRCGAAEGHLVIFDRTPDRPWKQKLFRRQDTAAEPPVTVWGM